MILDRKNSQKDTNSTNEHNTLMLKMVTSYSAFLLIILILFFFLYHSTIDNTRSSYNQQKESTLISNVELFENDLQIMEIYCRQLLQNDSFCKIMNYRGTHDPFMSLGIEVQTYMATDIYAEALLPIQESFCYFPLTNYVMNPSYFITADRFYNWIMEYPAEHRETFDAYLSEDQFHNRFLSLEAFTPYYSKNYYLYVIDLDDLFYRDAHAIMGFIIEQEEFATLFDSIQEDSKNFIIAVDSDNLPIFCIENGAKIDNPEFEGAKFDPNTISTLNFVDGFAEYKYYGENVTVGKYTSDNTNYTYYYSFPSFDTTSNTAVSHMAFLLIFAIALAVGAFLIFILSKRNVQPIIELGQELHEAVEAQNHLQEVVDSQRPIICTSYVRQLMSGTITSEEEAEYIRNYLELGDVSSYYNVLYVVVYNNSGDNTEALPADLSSPEELQNIISTALKNFLGAPLYYFSPSERTYSILLRCDAEKEKDFILEVSNAILQLHDYMLDTYDIWLFAGIGRNTNSLMNVWESYQQATEAVSYTTKNYIFYPYEFIKKKSDVFYYPPEISTKLIHFISSGNTAQVLELFNLIHQENIEERSLPINLLKYLLSDIRNTLLKARFALPSNADPETVKKMDERFNEHLSFKLCEDLALNLCTLFTNESEDNNLAATIEKYIAANYQDPSMGLNKISDEFQISESYFSHMFKEKTGVNFSTYLENIRMTEAVRLIKETDISLNELYLAVGYNNANSFRRAFKKVYGVTPSSMRDSVK